MTGWGALYWNNGNSYQGRLVGGEPHGQALHFRWGDGAKFVCQERVDCLVQGNIGGNHAIISIFMLVLCRLEQGNVQVCEPRVNWGGIGAAAGREEISGWLVQRPAGQRKVQVCKWMYLVYQVLSPCFWSTDLRTKNKSSQTSFAIRPYIVRLFGRKGKGTFYYLNGDRYVGGWARDKPEGAGMFHYRNGDRFEGKLKAGLFIGKGKFFFGTLDK